MVDWSTEDRLQRERLERQASAAPRLNAAAVLNGLAGIHSAREAPAFTALDIIRKRQELERRSPSAHNAAHAEFVKTISSEGAEGFNRLMPSQSKQRFPADADVAEHDRIGPDLSEAEKLLDALGRLLSGDRRALDHWSSGQVEPVVAQWLIEAVRERIDEERTRQQTQEAAHDVAAGRIPLHGRR